jgi:hypothetical protein
MRVNLSLTCTGRAMNQTLATLPGGRAFDPGRPRWRGPLDAEELAWCRANGVALGYDPAQIGWVALAPAAAAEAAPDEGPDEAPDEAPDAAPDAAPEEALRLRPWRAEDAPDFRALLDDPEIWRHLPEPYPAPLTAALAADLIALAALPHHDVRAIERGERAGGPGPARLPARRGGPPERRDQLLARPAVVGQGDRERGDPPLHRALLRRAPRPRGDLRPGASRQRGLGARRRAGRLPRRGPGAGRSRDPDLPPAPERRARLTRPPPGPAATRKTDRSGPVRPRARTR